MPEALRSTPLYAVHRELGARFCPFAGWDMPLRYDSEIVEHHCVRVKAGLFDLSHMGQIQVSGPEAGRALDYALTGRAASLDVGGARYMLMCHDNGGILDDLVVYRTGEAEFLVVANAANTAIVTAALNDRIDGFAARIRHADERALIAVQGPRSPEILQSCTNISLAALPYYAVAAGRVANRSTLVARTGYTGEDGFEIFCDGDDAAAIWAALTAAGQVPGLRPTGLACRDTLRLEAGMALYGNELHVGVNPFQARLGRVIAWEKPGTFVGSAALTALASRGPDWVLVGLIGTGKRAARRGYAVLDPDSGKHIGSVTSGAPSPTLGKPIALGYVHAAYAANGRVAIDLRGSVEPFTVTQPRFYRRSH